MEAAFVILAAGLAGFLDAVVGGGGLILVPALFATYPNTAPAILLANNKSASVWGGAMACWQYTRRVPLNLRLLAAALPLSFLGSMLGAWSVTRIDPTIMRQSLPFMLLAVLIDAFRRKDLGLHHAARFSGQALFVRIAGLAVVMGFYDGFFGPGTGSFLVFIMVRWMGFDFLQASAHAKWLNTASNAAALWWFSQFAEVWWHLALPMAVANVAGSFLGSRMAMRLGPVFVRKLFLGVVSALVLKTVWDAYLR